MSRTSLLISLSEARDVRDAATVTLRGGEVSSFRLALMDWIESQIIDAHTTLETSTDDKTLYRTQGRIEALRSLIVAITPRQNGFLGEE